MNMKMLIVDDEPVICQGLAQTIDWQSIGVEVVGLAFNGRQALQKVEQNQVDIILTDISMPDMDGLELAACIVQQHPDTKMIIISGYDDFEYARQAIRLGVEDYLLKPVDVDELMGLVKNVSEKIMLDRKVNSYPKEAELCLVESVLMQDEEKVKACIADTVSVMKANDYSFRQTVHVCQELELVLKRKLQERLPNRPLDEVELHLQNEMEVQEVTTLSAIEEIFVNDVIRILGEVDQSKQNHWVIENIKRYIDKNYQLDLRASELAEQHFITPNYFSMLFKQETGKSFSEYLNGLRIQKASELLLDTSNKVFEIAEFVGYKEYKYFVQVFKKKLGLTPTLYRRLNAPQDTRKKQI
ncbi:response regulator transcription factor [Alkalicoccobacillus murimartini]|uniref:Two-component system response regulator YesN n=1 Tax=Alkalicoccobacillus murimartini TaxID=171685 RepID=A0ABT9YHG6_9BACI|nr:response regulator [Alkalicoccobacillus murimartini]MDQ0206956.1 two-component system response regulator YesN [Alkalicoccobacillus murimartini]